MYQTTLKHRQHFIDAAAFAQAPNLLYNYCEPHQQDQFNIDAWEKHIPYTPRQMYNLIAACYGPSTRVFLTVLEEGNIKFEIRKDSGAPHAFETVLKIKPYGADRKVLESEIVVDPESQGKGVGRTRLRSVIEFLSAFNFTQFPFTAGLENGGYTWAKAGANIDCDTTRGPDSARTRNIMEIMNARLEAAKPFLTDAQYEQAHGLCGIQNNNDLVILTRMGDINIPKDVMGEARNIMENCFYESVTDANPMMRAKTQAEKLGGIFDSAAQQNKNVTLPKFLLAGTIWNAVIDFTNDTQMETVGRYVGGWNTIVPVEQGERALRHG